MADDAEIGRAVKDVGYLVASVLVIGSVAVGVGGTLFVLGWLIVAVIRDWLA